MTRYTITIDIEGDDSGEAETVIDRLLDAGSVQDLINEALDDTAYDARIKTIWCDSGEDVDD